MAALLLEKASSIYEKVCPIVTREQFPADDKTYEHYLELRKEHKSVFVFGFIEGWESCIVYSKE